MARTNKKSSSAKVSEASADPTLTPQPADCECPVLVESIKNTNWCGTQASDTPKFKIIQAPYTTEGRESAIKELKDLGLSIAYAHGETLANGTKVWEVCGKNLNAAERPGLSFSN